jgi:hypothetical protein
MAAVDSTSRSRGALPVCLDGENSHGLVSLWDMLKLHASKFVKLMDSVTVLSAYVLDRDRQDTDIPSPTFYQEMTRHFSELSSRLTTWA